MTCKLCNDTGEQRYWEGRWRNEKAENERLRAALKHIDRMLKLGNEFGEIPEIVEAALKIQSERWPDPTPAMLSDPRFEAIWNVIKTWDINVPEIYVGYMGATGSHVRAILDALSTNAQAENGRLRLALGEIATHWIDSELGSRDKRRIAQRALAK